MRRHLRVTGAVARRTPFTSQVMLGWWTADRGVDQSVTGSGVSSWADQSGQGRTLTQGTGGKQPTYQRQGRATVKPALRGRGTPNADVIGTTATGMWHGRTAASWLLTFDAAQTVTNDFIISAPVTAAGGQGVNAFLTGGNTLVDTRTQTNTTSGTTSTLSVLEYGAGPVQVEWSWDASRASQVIVTATGQGFNYGSIGGATLRADEGQFALLDFSLAGFTRAVAADIHECFVLTRAMSIGERRRWYRRAARKWQLKQPPDARWADGTLQTML